MILKYSFSLAAALLLACQPSEPTAGTRTHWLEYCDSEADCGEQEACICEVCTRQCSADSECDGGACASLVSAVGLCGEMPEGRICLPTEKVAECSTPLDATVGLGGAPNSSCPGVDVLLCESFDVPVSPDYQIELEGAGLAVESCLSQRGSGSLAFAGQVDGGYGQLQMALAEPVSSGTLYVRMWLYVPSQQESASARVFALGADPDSNAEQVGLYLTPTRGLGVAAGGVVAESPSDTFPEDEWFCVELAVEVASAGNTNLSLNGAPVFATGGPSTLPELGSIQVASIFGSVADPQPAFEFALDELVVAKSPIGCQ